eukprot:3809358-Amphidinium_carterae.1
MSASSSASRPALVRSAQADRLLGNGIKQASLCSKALDASACARAYVSAWQVARCTHCTRPLGKDAALTGDDACMSCKTLIR